MNLNFLTRCIPGPDAIDSLRAEVSLVDRNIELKSADDVESTGCGMRILGGEILMRHPTSGLPVTFTGSMNFDNVMIKGAGQSKFAAEEVDSRWGMAGSSDLIGLNWGKVG